MTVTAGREVADPGDPLELSDDGAAVVWVVSPIGRPRTAVRRFRSVTAHQMARDTP